MTDSDATGPEHGAARTVGTKQHRVPAALIGRFGRRQPGKP